MKVALAGFQAVSILQGGPHTQIRRTEEGLRKAGIETSFFDPWTRFDRASADLVHLFSAGLGTYHLAREIQALGLPLVVTPIMYSRHSQHFLRLGLQATRLLQRIGPGIWSDYQLMADICGWADRVAPNSRAEATLLSKGLGIREERVVVIPNGVEERFLHGDPALFRQKYGIDRFILNVGHIGHPRKNVLSLIRALATVDHPAVIIGRVIRNPYGEACVREAGKHKHILLLDGVEHSSELLASAYAACDTFVLPSQFETPGIAALEAGIAGAKLVITPHGGTREYFEDLAVYVDPDSVASIRAGIVRALEATHDDRLQTRIRRCYLWEHVAAQTAALYRTIVS